VGENTRVTSPEPDAPAEPTVGATVGWAELPEPVRRKLNGWAADALGAVPGDQIPVPLRRVARFAPTKRAKVGAVALSAALAKDPAFRGLVAGYVRSGPPAVEQPAAAPDPIAAAARAYLFGSHEAAELVDRAGQTAETERLRGEITDLRTELARTRGTVERLTAELDAVPARAGSPSSDVEADKLRGRLREQGTQLRGLRDQLETAEARTAMQVAELEKEITAVRHSLKLMTDRADASKVRADRAEEQVHALQAVAADGRAVADRRIELLLNTIRDAQAGLRRELRLGANAIDPAEAVLTGLPRPARSGGRSVDAALLTNWLTLPQAHLIVDGYNITKTGYGGLTLADQRDRLVRDLSAIASRTAAEVTVVFDGAAVIGHQVAGRGVRVLFSPPGVIADEVIKRLVAAEPSGRVLIVASSDREIVTDVAAKGARTVPAAVLLSLSGR